MKSMKIYTHKNKDIYGTHIADKSNFKKPVKDLRSGELGSKLINSI